MTGNESNEASNEATRNDPESLAPLQIERLSIEDEAATMNRGHGRQLGAIVAVLSAAGIVAAYSVGALERHQARVRTLASAAQLDREQGDAHLRCALPRAYPSQLQSLAGLISAIEQHGDMLGKAYGRTLRECAPKLEALIHGLNHLAAPTSAQPALDALRKAASAEREAWRRYAAYLDDERAGYDYVQALPMIEKIAQRRLGYRAEHERFAESMRSQL